MRDSLEEDFVTIRKRKSSEQGYSEVRHSANEKKRRKIEDKDGKISDVDFVDRTILRNIRVPKKIKECDDPLQRIDLLSKEFTREVTDVISRNLRDNHDTPFEIKACYLIHNRELQKRFALKRSTLKGEAANRENFGFCFYREFAAVRELAKNGIRVGNVERSLLGTAGNGVSFSQHADVVAQPHQMFGWIIICKYMKGRVNYVQLDEEPMEPQPGYECHLPMKSIQSGTKFPAFHYSQVYLYEYSDDFDIIEYPSHILPIAAVQIAAVATVMNGSNRKKGAETFGPRTQNKTSNDAAKRRSKANKSKPVHSQEQVVDAIMKSHLVSRPAPVPWGAPHSLGGFIAGSCILKIPLAINLEAEAVIISFSETRSSLPIGISASSLTLNRFIDLEDLYTTIFKDGMVKLSMTKEVHVINVGYFNYFRMILKDGSPNKMPMINFTSYLKTTNRACVLMCHHQDAHILLFPDAPVARDIGLPHSDPMAHPFSLHCVVLTKHRRETYYEKLCNIDRESKEDRASDHPHHQTVHFRYLRYSFQQQGEAQRVCLLQQLNKKSHGNRKFEYKSFSQMESSISSDSPDKLSRKTKVSRGGQSFRPKIVKEEEEDDIDDLAVLDSIDKMILEETSTKEKRERKKEIRNETKNEVPSKEVFKDPPASPHSDRDHRVEAVVHHAPVEVKLPSKPLTTIPEPKQEPEPVVQKPSDMKSVFSSMQSSLQSLVSTLQSQVNARGLTKGKTMMDENLESETSSETPATEASAKTSKDWYWFYHKNQNIGDKTKCPEPEKPPPNSEDAMKPSTSQSSQKIPSQESVNVPYIPGLGDPVRSDFCDSDERLNRSFLRSSHDGGYAGPSGPPRQPFPTNSRKPPGMENTNTINSPLIMDTNNPRKPPHLMENIRYPPRVNNALPPRSNYPHEVTSRRMPGQGPYPPSGPLRPPFPQSAAGFANRGQGDSCLGRSTFRPPRPPILATPNRPPLRPDNMISMHDVDLRTMPRPLMAERPNVLTSMHDVDMRRPPSQPQPQPPYRPGPPMSHREPLLRAPNRSARRISTYDPGLGFQ